MKRKKSKSEEPFLIFDLPTIEQTRGMVNEKLKKGYFLLDVSRWQNEFWMGYQVCLVHQDYVHHQQFVEGLGANFAHSLYKKYAPNRGRINGSQTKKRN